VSNQDSLSSSALFHHFHGDEGATWCFHLFLSHTRTIACCTVNFFASVSSLTLSIHLFGCLPWFLFRLIQLQCNASAGSRSLPKTSADTKVQIKKSESNHCAHVFERMVLLPEQLDVKHGINDASLVHFSNGADPLVFRVRADGLPSVGSNDTHRD